MTLREEVRDVLYDMRDESIGSEGALCNIADILEDTGAPAYMRVAKDLRGEWVEPIDTPPDAC